MGANWAKQTCCLAHSFNPRTRDGCEYYKNFDGTQPCSFNPRTRDGCEKYGSGRNEPTSGFNPRTRDGCEQLPVLKRVDDAVSIHAPVMGAKRGTAPLSILYGFNPRTRDGCEVCPCLIRSFYPFQSTHP